MENEWIKTLSDLNVYEAVPGTQSAGRSARGVPFVTLTSGGLKREGHHFPQWFTAEDHAHECFNAELANFCEGANAVYIRSRPEVKTITVTPVVGEEITLFNVWCRLAVFT